MNRTLKSMLVLSAMAAGTAWGQEGDFKKPLKARAAQGGQPSSTTTMGQSTTVMRSNDGENQVELRIQDGKRTATVNGKKVPSDRVVADDKQIKVLDENGETIAEFPVVQGNTITMLGQPGKAARSSKAKGEKDGDLAVAPEPMPKVMVGITMGEPSDELLKNYDLKQGEAILVERVIEGLPADKAGLKENDIITQIDGKKPVNQETLREVLRGKDAGDTVKFTVLRKGGDQTVRVTVEKFDSEKLGMAGGWTPGDQADQEKWRKQAENMLKDHQGHVFTLPQDGRGGWVISGQGADDRVAELDKKMADLDRKLEQVDEKIAKLQELIEKLAKQREHP